MSSRSNSAKPTIAVIGVRISWLMLARNSLFARLAASAVRRAASSCSFKPRSSSLAASSDWLRLSKSAVRSTHHLFQFAARDFRLAGQVPAAGERHHQLPDLDVVERLLQDQQVVRSPQLPDNVFPGVVRIGGAKHDEDFRIDAPDALDRFHAVPAGRHADVDKCQRVGAILLAPPVPPSPGLPGPGGPS